MNPVDRGIISFFNDFAHKSRFFDSSMVFLSEHDFLKGGVFMAMLWFAWFRHHDGERNRRDYLLSALVMSIVAVIIARLLADALPFRDRPMHTASLHFQLPYKVEPSDFEGWSSFPSDHAVLFFSLATSLYVVWRPLGVFGFLYAFFAICLPRVYLGVHWPTDIVAGAALGVALGWLSTRRAVRELISTHPLRWFELYPGLCYAALFVVTFETVVLFGDARDLAHWLKDAI